MKTFTELLGTAEKTDSYWVEAAKLDFAQEIDRNLKDNDISRKELAERLGSKPSYVTKVLRGDSNLTIETMVKLARAVDGRLELHIAHHSTSATRWFDVARPPIGCEQRASVARLFARKKEKPHASDAGAGIVAA